MDLMKITKPLLAWYRENARVLPWRENKEPYKIWISEVMLQQTRIEAVKQYYARFMEELPTVRDLAAIEEERLLKLWEGLGYYSRAKNLKKAAEKVMQEYCGKMPGSYAELLSLPGIGEYTAGAIASIAYDERVPAVDGNVLRVVARVKGSRENVLLPEVKKQVTKELSEIMPEEAGDFNQALMELGETVCLPNGEPVCEKCPLKAFCIAQKEGITAEIPIREKKTERRKEERNVFLIRCGEEIAIRKRPEKGLLANLYEFPNFEKKEQSVEDGLAEWGFSVKQLEEQKEYKHIFSHVEWKMSVYEVEVEEKNAEFLWVRREELLEKYPIASAFAPIVAQL